MKYFKKILSSIRIEEYVLTVSSLLVLLSLPVIFYFLGPEYQKNYSVYFDISFKDVAWGIGYFFVALYVILFYGLWKIYSNLVEIFQPWAKEGKPIKRVLRDFLTGFRQRLRKVLKTFFGKLFFLLRPFVFTTLFFGIYNVLLGFMAAFFQKEGLLYDGLLLEFDRTLFGFHVSLLPYYNIFIVELLADFWLWGYKVLGIAMGLAWLLLFFSKKRKLFSQYLMAMVLSVILSIPFWAVLPSNSPRYINNVYHGEFVLDNYSENIDKETKAISDGKLGLINHKALDFYEQIGIKRGDVAPVSTIPSMHIVWAGVILYYLFLFDRRSIFLTLPWYFFSGAGAVYLGQHYFADVLFSIPLTVVVIILTKWLFELGERYYRESVFDIEEKGFKQEVGRDFLFLVSKAKRGLWRFLGFITGVRIG